MRFSEPRAQLPEVKFDVYRRIRAVMEHGQFIAGPEVEELERKLGEFVGAYCVSCASGTHALHLSLMALGVGRGDEVITTPFTFAATVEAILMVGAKPVYADIGEAWLIDAMEVERRITSRTKAIIPVSLYGQPADMDALNAMGLPVIEDGAQSFGATYHGRRSCGLSAFGCTSFFPSKPLGCYGDGGAVFVQSADHAQRLRMLRNHGQAEKYDHRLIGMNARLDTLQAAVLLGKLGAFEWEIGRRQEIARRYGGSTIAGRSSAWAQFTVPDRARIEACAGDIPTVRHYPMALHEQEAFREDVSLPNAERAAREVVSVPIHPYLSERDIERVAALVRGREDADGNHRNEARALSGLLA